MVNQLINFYFEQDSYPLVYLLTTIYFAVLYFGLAPLFLTICKLLERRGIASKIHQVIAGIDSVKFEVKNSVTSIIVFGFSGLVLLALVRGQVITLAPATTMKTLEGVLLLTIWNELHFYLTHRLMHLPYFYRNIHKVHHQSKIPSVYSVYSFHWFEALLLSTVPFPLALFVDLSPLAFLFYPLVSILLNFAGHCNYRLGAGKWPDWILFGTRHAQHHYLNKANFGFVSGVFDRIFKPNRDIKKQ